MNLLLIFILAITLNSCSSEPQVVEDSDVPVNYKSLESQVKNEIERRLNIPLNEDYSYEIVKGHLNGDDSLDAIITVNRYAFALDEASKSPNPAQIAELGYTGNYNFFIFYDGNLKRFSNPITVPSSPKAKLRVKLENIHSEVYKDITIEYRVRNSAFKNYYLIENGVIQMIFQWKLFDFIGDDNPEVNFLEYGEGTLSSFKDIYIFKGKILNYSKNITDVYTYDPVVEKNGELIYHFFYNPKMMKYVTIKK